MKRQRQAHLRVQDKTFSGRPVAMSSAESSAQSRRVCVLSWDQVRRLDSILGESVPIHGRGNFPTLSVQPRQIVQVRLTYCASPPNTVRGKPAAEASPSVG